MAKLIVNTLPDVNSVTAFVANEEGVPEPGLGLENFKVRPTVPGADGTLLMVDRVAMWPLPGFYALGLATVGTSGCRKGLYIFDLVVERGEDRGQNMSSAIIS